MHPWKWWQISQAVCPLGLNIDLGSLVVIVDINISWSDFGLTPQAQAHELDLLSLS